VTGKLKAEPLLLMATTTTLFVEEL